MNTIIQRLAQGATRLLVLALGLGLTATGWGAKPAAIWNGDFNVETRGLYTLSLNNNTLSADNKVITITSDSAGGVSVIRSPYLKRSVTGIIALNTNNVDVANTPMLGVIKNGRSNNICSIFLDNTGTLKGMWNGSGSHASQLSSTAVYPTGAQSRCFAIDYIVRGGTSGYVDGTQYYKNTGLSDGYENVTHGILFGGLYSDNSRNLANAEIKFIAVFETDSTSSSACDNIEYWSLTEMTTVSTDINTTTTTDGVNLPASATLTASATPAAVFVQQTSTLTVTGAGSLNINSGNGPLYVADGTTLTIDATGITSLTAQNPSVTLVSAKIYGTDLVTVKVPVVSGGRATASVTENGITLTYSGDTVSITSPFDGSTLSEPTSATGYGASSTSISFGNTEAFQQTIDGRAAIVADVFGGSFTDINGFMKQGETTSNTNKDVYLVVSGATARRINGVQEAHWSGNTRRTRTEGNAIVQIEDGATVDYVYGAGYKGGRMPTTVDGTGDSGASAQVQGNTGVTVKGGTVNGSIIGGWSCAHNGTPTVTGNTAVRIEKVLGTATATAEDGNGNLAGEYVIGGSVHQSNEASGSLVGGNSSVTLALTGKNGTFNRTVIGGSAQLGGTTSGNHNVTGNSSVTITAANDVAFPNQIVGGGVKLVSSGSGVVNVGGNSSVTISGGTYTGRIVAGGYAPNGGTANVSGTATLTLNSGVFTGATLDGGNATGVKTLAVGDNLDISDATATGFTAVMLGDGATARMTVGEEGSVTLGDGATLILDVTDEAVADGHTATVVSKGAGASIKYYENGVEITDSSRLDGDNLNASAPVWSPAEADASGNFADVSRWSTGALPADNTSVVKLVVNGNNTLTINETRTFGHLFVEGSGTLSIQGDTTHYLYANDVTIASGVTIKIVGFSGAFQPKNGTISGGTAIVIPSQGFLQLDGVACSTKIELQSGGYLWTKGTTSLSSTANTFASGGQLVTKTGTNESPSTTTVHSAGTSFNSTVTVEENSTLIAEHTGDMVDWTASTRINVYGKLTVNCRWSMNPSNQIYFYPGAVIDGTGGGTAIFDMLKVNSVIHVAANPDSGATGTVTCSAPIRLRANATVDVAEGMTFTMTGESKKQTNAMGYTKTGLGVFNINGTYSAGGTTTVSAGEVVQTVAMQGPVSIGDNGTYTLKNQPMTQVISGTGKLELLKDSTDTLTHTADSTFSGALKITRNNSTGHHVFGNNVEDTSASAKFLTGSPSLEIGGTNPYLCLGREVAGNWLAVKNLTASSADLIVDAVYGGANDNTYVIRTIKTLQTADTTFAGKFNGASKTGRRVDLYVYGENETVHSLELTGNNTAAYGTLTVKDYGKVKFSGSGNWAQGNVVVGANGWLESSNAGAVKDLTLSDGANIVFPTSSSSLTGITSLTFTSGKTYISFADGAPDSGTLIDWSSVGSAPDGDFELVGDVAETHVLTKSATGLTIAKGVASVTTTSGVTHYSSVAEARLQAMNAGENLLYFTIVTGGDVSIAYFEGMKIKNAGGANITITGVSSEYTMNSSTEDGVTTYTRSNAPTAYVWTDAYSDFNMETYVSTPNHNWTVPGNWNVVGGTAAGRYPDAGDTVTFNDGATVTLNATASVAGGEVNGAVSISGSGVSLNVSGNITGSGTLTLSDVCLASAGAGITVAPAVNFTNDSELAGDNALTLNGDVAISDTFKVWNSSHAINGNVTINSGVTFKYGALLLINGAATVKGAFTRDAGSTSCIKFCGAVTIENGNVSIDGWQSGNLDDAATVVLAGSGASLTDTRGTPITDNKVSTTVADSYVKKSGNTFSVAAKRTATVSVGSNVSLTINGNEVANGDTLKFVPGDVLTIAASADTYYTPALTVNSVAQTSPYQLTTTDADVTVSATATLDTYTITIPFVANTTVSVSYTSGGAAQVATADGDITVDAGTSLTATWTAVSGYRITAGGEQTINPVASSQTLTEPTVVANEVTFGGYTVEYTADYTKAATISATVSGDGAEGATYTLTAGGNNYNGTYNAGTVTFSNVTAPSLGGELSYTISATGTASGTSPAQTETVGNVTSGWVQEDATHNESTGTWETPVTYSGKVATITNNTYTANTAGDGIVTLTTVVNFGGEADSEVQVGDDAQAAIRIQSVESTPYFQVYRSRKRHAAR